MKSSDEGSDDEGEGPEEAEEAEEMEPEAQPKETRVSVEKLRETLREIVDEALRDAMELRGKGRMVKIALAKDLHHLRGDIRRALEGAMEGAASTLEAIDMGALRRGLRGRTNTLMTRVKDEDLERMDLLVEAGLFESRSQCAAFLIHAGLEARRDLVEKVKDTAERISDLKDQLRKELSGEDTS